ncbi:MAG: hypothetical protein Kow0063_36820 [Anaerolineae bacterium]
METITLTVAESQIIEWIRQLSPQTKQAVLRVLIPELDKLEVLVDYGTERMRQLCAARGMDWDSLSEEERQQLIDELLHET